MQTMRDDGERWLASGMTTPGRTAARDQGLRRHHARISL
jgi:hypothetical protein